jgi:hypothetical protein
VIREIYFFLIFAPALIFPVATVLYGIFFHWVRTFQGRSTMGLLVALDVLLLMNAARTLTYKLTDTSAEWWIYFYSMGFVVLTAAGINFCVSIVRSRQRNPKG